MTKDHRNQGRMYLGKAQGRIVYQDFMVPIRIRFHDTVKETNMRENGHQNLRKYRIIRVELRHKMSKQL